MWVASTSCRCHWRPLVIAEHTSGPGANRLQHLSAHTSHRHEREHVFLLRIGASGVSHSTPSAEVVAALS